MAAPSAKRHSRTLLVLLSCFGVGFAANTYYMQDYCNQSQFKTVLLETTGERSSVSIRAYRTRNLTAVEGCASAIKVLAVRPDQKSAVEGTKARIVVSIHDLDTVIHPKENYCIDYLDIQGLRSLVSRFCGSLEDTYPRAFESINNQLFFIWNFFTGLAARRGFNLVLTAFVERRENDANWTCGEDQGRFLCNNGHCIDARWRCDRRNNCGDYSDEDRCFDDGSFVVNGLWLGITAAALVLAIGVLMAVALWKCRQPAPILPT